MSSFAHSQFAALFVYWLSGGLLAYTFVGYGALMALLGRRTDTKTDPPLAPVAPPEVCVVVVAYNEEARIVPRIENLLAADYPPEKLRVLVVSDGSTDATAARVAALHSLRVQVLEQPVRSGKAAGLNAALSQCNGEIVVFTDTRQTFAADVVTRLVAHFADPQVGAVSGELEIASASSTVGAGIDAYWRYERFLRAAESRLDSCIGCTGAIYAIRRDLFVPIPPDTLLDDVVIPMQIAVRGARVIHDPSARAFDPQPLEPTAERRRKQRTMAGNFQMLFRYPSWLFPWRNRLWWQLLSHKYLRLFAPVLLILAFGANCLLATSLFYRLSLVAFSLLFVSAMAGVLPGAKRFRFLTLPTGFVFLNMQPLRGFWYYITRRNDRGWN